MQKLFGGIKIRHEEESETANKEAQQREVPDDHRLEKIRNNRDYNHYYKTIINCPPKAVSVRKISNMRRKN